MMNASAVITLDKKYHSAGETLAERFSIPHYDVSGEELSRDSDIKSYLSDKFKCGVSGTKVFLIYQKDGLSIAQITADNLLFISANFYGESVRYRREKGGGKREMIAKAIGLNYTSNLSILDATCGLGNDAFVLASIGGHVTMIERVAEVHALVEFALKYATEWGKTADSKLLDILSRMELIKGDAIKYMLNMCSENRPDVIYLDPMFPPRKKSAKIKKEMQVMHNVVGSDTDSNEMLPIALHCARKRVVVKRPRVAPTLSRVKVNYTFKGKSNRYDVYVCSP